MEPPITERTVVEAIALAGLSLDPERVSLVTALVADLAGRFATLRRLDLDGPAPAVRGPG